MRNQTQRRNRKNSNNQAKKGYLHTHAIFVAFMLVLLSLGIGVWYRDSQEQRKKKLAEWPLISIVPMNVTQDPPKVPAFLTVPLTEQVSYELALERVKDLIRLDPLPEVSHDFLALVQSGEVKLVVASNIPGAGRFAFLKGGSLRPPAPPDQATKNFPVLILNTKYILYLQSEQDVREAWLLIDHEVGHQRDRFADIKKGTLDPLFLPDWQGKLDKQQCGLVWNDEFIRYHRQCEIAVRWGGSPNILGPMCDAVGSEAAFKQRIFKILQDPRMGNPECVSTWARAAGHPHPEAFE